MLSADRIERLAANPQFLIELQDINPECKFDIPPEIQLQIDALRVKRAIYERHQAFIDRALAFAGANPQVANLAALIAAAPPPQLPPIPIPVAVQPQQQQQQVLQIADVEFVPVRRRLILLRLLALMMRHLQCILQSIVLLCQGCCSTSNVSICLIILFILFYFTFSFVNFVVGIMFRNMFLYLSASVAITYFIVFLGLFAHRNRLISRRRRENFVDQRRWERCYRWMVLATFFFLVGLLASIVIGAYQLINNGDTFESIYLRSYSWFVLGVHIFCFLCTACVETCLVCFNDDEDDDNPLGAPPRRRRRNNNNNNNNNNPNPIVDAALPEPEIFLAP